MTTHHGIRRARAGVILLAVAAACGPRASTQTHATANGVRVANLPSTPSDNFQRLATLSAERRATANQGESVLGEGDLLSLRAVGLDELTQKVRVDPEGTITLPLLGTVPVAGKTPAAVQRDLTQRLGAFMYHPHVDVFVEEFRSQQVGVVGSVQHPGLVNLAASHGTILDALSAAGGMTPDAGGRIYLIPSSRTPGSAVSGVSATTASDPAPASPPIMFDVKELGDASQSFFSLPIRPGDVIMVPGTGEFVVDGWVNKPGTYPIKSALTLRAAIGTGGGLMFPARKDVVHINRLIGNGQTETQEVDFGAIKDAKAPDVFIHDGDVIEVGSSPTRLVPYAFYKLAVDIVHVGAGIPIVP